jgi:hypothetical protein
VSVAVLIPWAGSCAHRLASLRFVESWYGRHFPDWKICIGSSQEGPEWCKAEAVAKAAYQTKADIFVVADADCFSVQIGSAVEAVRNSHAWAMPHYTVNRLSAAASRQVIEGTTQPSAFPRNRQYYAQMPYTGYPGGGIAVVRREVYASCPLDPRFVGWGQEDESWAIALKALYGAPWRPRTGPLWHLWHPPQRRMSRAVGSANSQKLRTAYRAAARDGSMPHMLGPARRYVSPFLEAP